MNESNTRFRIREQRRANSLERTIRKRGSRGGRSLFLGAHFLVAAVASVFALAQQNGGDAEKALPLRSASDLTKSRFAESTLPIHKVTSEEQAFSSKTEFGQFSPCTEAERELEKMLHGRDEDIDLALANWLIAADIPQFHDMRREFYFAQLDAMIEQVRRDMARMQTNAISRGANLNDPGVRCGIFCNAIIKLRFGYSEEFRQHDLTPQQDKTLHGDANNTFLAGLVRTRRGSCVSMPLIYLVIGQRLGVPVHLVALGRHYFIRWQEPGYRMNIETTAVDKVWVTDDDSVYMDDERLTRNQLKGSDLRNLTNREVVGQLFFTRSSYWVMTAASSRSRSWMDLSRARHLAPEDSAITKTYQAVFNHYGITPDDTLASIEQREIGRN